MFLPDQHIIPCQFTEQLRNEVAVGTVTQRNGRHGGDFYQELQAERTSFRSSIFTLKVQKHLNLPHKFCI